MQSDEGLKKWLMNIQQYGIGFVDGVPVNPTVGDIEWITH
jgi:hypothetical protein